MDGAGRLLPLLTRFVFFIKKTAFYFLSMPSSFPYALSGKNKISAFATYSIYIHLTSPDDLSLCLHYLSYMFAEVNSYPSLLHVIYSRLTLSDISCLRSHYISHMLSEIYWYIFFLEICRQICPIFFPGLGNLGIFRIPFCSKLIQILQCNRFIRRSINQFKICHQFF